jgi:hypothetical protein
MMVLKQGFDGLCEVSERILYIVFHRLSNTIYCGTLSNNCLLSGLGVSRLGR